MKGIFQKLRQWSDKKKQDPMRFSKKIIIFTMGCTLAYAVVYMILCYRIGMQPDYSFNAGLFAALSAENVCNAMIKMKEASAKKDDEAAQPDPEPERGEL